MLERPPQSALVLYSFTEARARSLETEIETNLEVLVKEQVCTLFLRQETERQFVDKNKKFTKS